MKDLLRVIKHGLQVKCIVDTAIEACAQVFNLHKAIEEARIAAEETTDEREKRREIQKGPWLCSHSLSMCIYHQLRSTPPPAIF